MQTIGYTFQNPALFRMAMTHSSYTNEHPDHPTCNERLEFLGDSVLELLVSRYIFEQYPHFPEGKLTKLRAAVVCEQALYRYAKQIELGKHLFLGKGEERSGGRERSSVLADAMEALLAAIYLDSDLETAKNWLFPLIKEEIQAMATSGNKERFHDYKTALQEYYQSQNLPPITYRVIHTEGPDHNRTFEVEALSQDTVLATGRGRSKKEAEQAAAEAIAQTQGIKIE